MPARGGLNALTMGVYAVAGALLLLLLLAAAALEDGTAFGLVAVLACALGWGLSWLLAFWFGGSPWLHGLALIALPLAFELYSIAARDEVTLRLRIGWLALLAVTGGASVLGARRGLAAGAGSHPR